MRKLLFSTILIAFATVAYNQTTPCNDLPIASPEVKATAENADAYLQEHLPTSIGATENTHGVFKASIDCDGVVGTVTYQTGEMTDQQANDMIDVIKNLNFTAAQNGGENVKTFVFISLKISAGQASCGIN